MLAVLPEARIVGGAVRDVLLAQPVADLDLAAPLTPEQVAGRLESAGLHALPTGLAHGTLTVAVGGRNLEITSLREDIETDGRHAEVRFTTSWQRDASRRDFTLNALSLSRTGAVFDYYGGLADLIAGRLRFVGRAEQRIAEDRLRVLRYFRFFARFGRLPPDPASRNALALAAAQLENLSAERVWGELKRLLAAPEPRPALRLMQEAGVLAAILPEAEALSPLDRLAALGAPPDPMLRLAALVEGAARPDTLPALLAARFRLSNEETRVLKRLLSGPVAPETANESALRRLLADEPAEILVARTLLAGTGGAAGAKLRARLWTTPRPVFPLVGRDALAIGLAPGPAVGLALKRVRAWWLAGGCVAGRAACLAQLREPNF